MSTLDSLREDLRKVLKGDLDPGELDLKDTPVDIERLPNVSLRSLYAEHYRFSLVAAAARQLGFGTLEKTANACLSYMSILTKKFHNKDLQTLVIDAQDSAETVLSLIDELEDTMLKSLKKSKKNSCEIVEARDGNAVDSGQVETAKDNAEGPSNELETVHIDESIEVGCEDAAPIHSGNNGQRSQERGDSDKKKGEGPSEQELGDIVEAQDTNAVDSGQVESAKDNGERPSNDQGRVREVPSIHSGKQSTRNGEGHVERGETSKKKCESGKKKVKEDIKTHYTSRKCPLCKKSVCILKRHIIDVHVR